MPDNEATKWILQEPADWRDAVNSWQWLRMGIGWIKSGTCTVCGHAMSVRRLDPGVVTVAPTQDTHLERLVGERSDNVGPDAGRNKLRFASCNCSVEHPGRPPHLTVGCGAWADVMDASRGDGEGDDE